MKNLKRSTLALSILIALLCATGCGEYIPRTVHEITTTDGQIIKLACPVVESGRSTFTYLIDGDCIIYK